MAKILLEDFISPLGSVAVAFSGGVDSSVVASVSMRVLGKNAVAVTVDTGTIAGEELKHAKKMAAEIGIEHVLVKAVMPGAFFENRPDRCYVCKKEIIGILRDVAGERTLENVIDGTNADDLHSDRPGLKALNEEGIISPLARCGIGKGQVREIAKSLGLSNWNRQSKSCLATMVPFGMRITKRTLISHGSLH